MVNIWKDYPQKPLPDLLEFIVDNRGKTVLTVSQEKACEIVLIATNCIRNENLYPVYEKVRYISRDTYENWFRAHPQSGDIIFVNKGTPGRVCFCPEHIDFCIAQDMMAFRADSNKLYNKYLLAVLRSRMMQEQIRITSVGDTIPHFKKEFLKDLFIPVPPMEIQRIIGDYYYKLSQIVELNKKINENLEQQAQAIFKSWFVDFKPFGGVMPEDWNVCTLDSICNLIIKGITPKYTEDSEQLVINQKCVRNHQIDLSLARPHIPKKTNEKWLKYGDILVNSTGTGTLGRAAQVLFVPNNLTVDSHVTIIRASKAEYIHFLGLWATSHEHDFVMLQTGSTGQTDLPRERLKKMQILLPSIDILKKFSSIIKPISDTQINNHQENQRLSALRDTLLPKLMNGEIDVSQVRI